jgi:hypothetical protein
VTADTHWDAESLQVYVVYDAKSGAIVHIHRIMVHGSTDGIPDHEAQARALELAGRFGHRPAGLRVLRADNFDFTVEQRVNPKTQQLSVEKLGVSRARLKTASRKKRTRK